MDKVSILFNGITMGGGGSAPQPPPYNWCDHHLRGQQRNCGFEHPFNEANASRNRTTTIRHESAIAENNARMNLLRQRETERLLDREKNNNVMATEYMSLLRKKLEALRDEEEARRRLQANSPWTFDVDPAVESSVSRNKMEDVFLTLMLDQLGIEDFYLRQNNDPLASNREQLKLVRQNAYFDTGNLLDPYITRQKLFVGNYPTGLAALGDHPWITNDWKYFTYDQTLFKVKRLT